MAFLSKLFGKKDKDENKKEEIELDELLDEAEEESEGLTDEEIEAAEKFESENREEYENATSLDVDGEFIDYESLIPDDEDAEYDEDELEEEENAEALADVEEVYGDGEEEEAEENEEEEEEEKVSFWERLKSGLAKTKKALFGSVHDLLSNFVRVDEDLLDELEELLIMSDIGVNATEQIIDELRERIKDGRLKEKDQVIDTLKEILGDMIGEHQPLVLETSPAVILVIGVNGAGKTTSIGKISNRLRLSGKKVVVAAADTFRAPHSEWTDPCR